MLPEKLTLKADQESKADSQNEPKWNPIWTAYITLRALSLSWPIPNTVSFPRFDHGFSERLTSQLITI